MSSENLRIGRLGCFWVIKLSRRMATLPLLTSRQASETAVSAISEARLDIDPNSLKGGWNSGCETREFARTTILRPCVKRLGMSSYLLALNGWGLYAYGRLGNLRL
jgi:hypothetical protein